MKKTLIFLILITFYNCSEKKESIKHKIPFLNGEINIPENYNLVSFDDYEKIIIENYKDSIFIEDKKIAIKTMKENFSDYLFFCDNNDFENTLIIYPTPNQKVDKYLKEELTEFMVKHMKSRSTNENFTYENIQNKIIENKIIKIKGRMNYLDLPEKETYTIQYIAEKNNRRFTAYLITHNKDLDFEKEITEIKYN